MRRAAILALALAGALLWSSGCSRSTWKAIGDDTRKAMETTGKAIEGAVKGGIDAVEKKE